MMRQYELLNLCLRELQGSRVPSDKKLRIEVLLLQTKLVLLRKEVESQVWGNAASEREFFGLYERVRQVCGRDCQADMDLLIGQLVKLKETLNDYSEAKRTDTGPGTKERDRALQTFTRTV